MLSKLFVPDRLSQPRHRSGHRSRRNRTSLCYHLSRTGAYGLKTDCLTPGILVCTMKDDVRSQSICSLPVNDRPIVRQPANPKLSQLAYFCLLLLHNAAAVRIGNTAKSDLPCQSSSRDTISPVLQTTLKKFLGSQTPICLWQGPQRDTVPLQVKTSPIVFVTLSAHSLVLHYSGRKGRPPH